MPSTLHEYKTIPSRENDSGKTEYALAISAQKFHFQDEKSKIIAMEKEKDQVNVNRKSWVRQFGLWNCWYRMKIPPANSAL